MSPPSSPTPKKGLSTGAMIGIGCGGVLLLGIIGFVVVVVMLGGRLKNFAEESQKNPARATASLMVATGAMEMVAEDDANKRYTVKDKKSGALTTIYWDSKKNAPEVISGDFSAIPTDSATPTDPAIPAPEPDGTSGPDAEK